MYNKVKILRQIKRVVKRVDIRLSVLTYIVIINSLVCLMLLYLLI